MKKLALTLSLAGTMINAVIAWRQGKRLPATIFATLSLIMAAALGVSKNAD